MRRRYLAMILAMRSADALSLGNFQQITSILLPSSCSSAYDGQIPSCVVSDFQNQCSTACQSGLDQVQQSVQKGCSNVFVNPNALLGIVMNGGIIAALCPSVAKATTTVAKTTTPVAVSSAAASVTLPTASPGVTGGEGVNSKKSTTAASVTQVTIPTTRSTTDAASTTSRTAVSSTLTTATSTSAVSSSAVQSISTDTAQGSGASSTSTTSVEDATSRKGSVATSTQGAADQSPKAAPKAGEGGGGGSPFDISSNSADQLRYSVLSVVMAAAWTGFLLVR